jgi:hypothetical protein
MKKLNLFWVILCSCILIIKSLTSAYAAQPHCSRTMVNHTNRTIIDFAFNTPRLPGRTVTFPITCEELAAKYPLGVHRYYNRQNNFFATTIRDTSNPNTVTVIISDRL